MSDPSDVLRNRNWTISKTGSEVLIQCEHADDARAVFDWLTEFASFEDKDVVVPCSRCKGSGWCWCDEMPGRAGHERNALVVDDTRYTCPDCGGSGKTKCDMTDGPCSCGAWH